MMALKKFKMAFRLSNLTSHKISMRSSQFLQTFYSRFCLNSFCKGNREGSIWVRHFKKMSLYAMSESLLTVTVNCLNQRETNLKVCGNTAIKRGHKNLGGPIVAGLRDGGCIKMQPFIGGRNVNNPTSTFGMPVLFVFFKLSFGNRSMCIVRNKLAGTARCIRIQANPSYCAIIIILWKFVKAP